MRRWCRRTRCRLPTSFSFLSLLSLYLTRRPHSTVSLHDISLSLLLLVLPSPPLLSSLLSYCPPLPALSSPSQGGNSRDNQRRRAADEPSRGTARVAPHA